MKKRLKPISVFLSFLFAFQIILSNASTVAYALTNQLISFAYQDFNALAKNNMLTLQSDAALVNGQIRLTRNAGNLAGSAFYKQKVSVANDKSFSSFFTFQMKSTGSRADGIVFVLDTNTNSIGSTGAAIGYGGIQNSIGIEFDTYQNTGYYDVTKTANMNDPDNNHIGINVNGSPVSVASKSLGPLGIDLADGATKYAWVDYKGDTNQLEVRISKTNSRPELPTLAYTINLSQTLGSNEVYSGFTAATGGSYEEHDIVSWYFDSKYNPIDTTKNTYISAPTTVSVSATPSTAVTNNSTVNINVKNADGSNAANIPVTLTADYGTLDRYEVITDGNGNATTIFNNSNYSPGNAVIKAVAQGGAYNYCTISYTGVPRISNFTKNGVGDTLMNFTKNDFSVTYTGMFSSLTSVIIKSLPDNGVLVYDGIPVGVSQEIPISYIDKLTFMPNKYWHGNTSFNWAARGSQGAISNTAIETLAISAVNHAPETPEGFTTSLFDQHHKAGDIVKLKWAASVDHDNDQLTYVLEYGDGENWSQIYSGNALEYNYTLPSGYSSQFSMFRVKAVDPGKLESGYTYSEPFAQDSEKPVIRLIGMQSRTIQVGLTYTEEGATAFDNFDGDLNDKLVKTGSVDTSKIGDYAITYTVSDAAGNTSTVVRDVHVIDITKPIISLKGDSDETLEVNHDYIEKGATATDNYNGDVSKDIAISGTVDTHKLGDYVISYDVKDSSNNSADTVKRTIHVVDTTKPVITINGDSEVTLEVHNDYVDAGAVASDNYDSEIASRLSVTGTVDPDKLGDYTIYYNAKDGSNNTADTVKRIVHVVDTTKPVLSINGKKDITVEVHSNYLDEGVTAEDNYDSDIASKVIRSGEVNTDKLGDYVISYDVKDASNNVATTVKRNIHVVDTTKPTISLVGKSDITLEVHSLYVDLGAVASDNYDNELSSAIDVNGNLNTDKLGDYTIAYNVKDSSGNKADTILRTIHVVDTTKPVIKLKGEESQTIEVHKSYEEAGFMANDNYDNDLTSKVLVSGAVNTDKLGDYTLSYDVKDSSNNSAITLKRIVHVVDTTKPVITLKGEADINVEVHKSYTDEGVSATDNYDNDITPNVTTSGKVNADKIGQYVISYDVKDSSGNVADTVKRTIHVVDTTKPIISLKGETDKTIEVHNSYVDPGATAADNYDEDITSKITKTGEVNTDKVGDYSISYDVKDNSNNAADTAKRVIHVVDTTNPIIALKGDSDEILEVNHDYVEKGATATDNYNGNISKDIVISGSVDTHKLGDYVITYNVKDEANNSASTVKRIVHVVDSTKPVITVKGDSEVSLEVHNDYVDAGAVASDNYDSEIASKLSVTGTVDPDKLGDYTIYYNAKDGSNNTADTVKRIVHVVDTTKPVLSINGKKDITVEVHSNYLDEGVTAEDNYDSDTASKVIKSGEVNTDKLGDYVISYDVKDSSNNVAATVKRNIHVVDTTKPTVSLVGKSDITLEVHSLYVDLGAVASDNYDNELSSAIDVNGNLNTDKLGDYTIAYNVKDSSGNKADTILRTIHVVDTTKPIIKLKGEESQTIEVHKSYEEAGFMANDNYDNDLTSKVLVSGAVNTDKLGDYTLSYDVKDSSNNSAITLKRIVHVVDSTKPVITLKGDAEQTIEVHSKYVDPGVTLIDNYDNDINSKLVISGAVNTDKLGDYTIVYNVKDGSGNTADTVARTIHVKDTTKPVIDIVGDSVVTVEAQNTYTDSGATATDNYDSNLTASIKVKGSVDTNKIGEYTISYDVSDLSGNKADTVKRTVKVVDTKKPIIEMKGDSDITLEVGTEYKEQGATAKDNYDGDITGKIVMDSNINTNVKGNYFVKYNVMDTSGNAAKEVVRNIHIIDKIESITLSGQVFKQEDNSLIAGADISLYDLEEKLIYKTTSDSKGIYLLPNVKLGQYILEAHDSNNNVTSVQIDAKPNSVLDTTMKKDIALVNYKIEMDSNPNTIVGDGVSTTKLSVVVKDKNGNTLKGLKVDFDASKGSFPNGNSAVTDNNGTAYVDYKSDKIESTTSEVIPVKATITDAKNGLSTSRQILVTFEPGSIQGIVVDNETGTPISGAVIVVSKDFNNDGIVDFYAKMVTDESGKYKIAVPKGNISYDVNITKPVKIGDTVQLKTFKQNCVAGDINGDKKETYASNNTVAGLLLTKDTNGKTSVLTSYNGLSMAVFDSSKTDVKKGQDISNVKPEMLANIDSSQNGGAFQAEGLSVGKEYVLAVYYTFPSGQKLIVGTASVNVAESGQINITNVLIDPYGTITDSATGKAIDGVHVVLYYANTARNIAQGIKPDTIVNLPEVKGFKPADNANPQESTVDGEYAFMVFPNTDYYVKADKAGYDTFKSPTISVNNEIVRFDVTMNKTTKPVVPTTPDKSEVVKDTPNTVVTNKAGTDKTITPVNTPDKAVKQTNLPKTGGLVDSNLLFVIGAIVIVIGGVVLARRKRR
ncbi:immunoglobulin-like domain-containing protein [Clostridium sp. C8-1-8]|uniref:immunoglobulin-like domain-containing protein n=1 Tax=Clostridium sp. C8-1-8 TaxID=2698831 RepID=UPI0013711059|nr:immunoglobulin-like domain-containing protein [Clostridium sp. C8-1-8]